MLQAGDIVYVWPDSVEDKWVIVGPFRRGFVTIRHLSDERLITNVREDMCVHYVVYDIKIQVAEGKKRRGQDVSGG